MSAFAKLFEREGKQVLVTKEEGDDGQPCLQFRFTSDVMEHGITSRLEFRKDSELSEWDVLDRAFDSIDEAKAFGIRDNSPAVKL